jgi:hypothetical protein
LAEIAATIFTSVYAIISQELQLVRAQRKI